MRLRADRIRELSAMMLDSQGGTFPCHKTVDYSDDPESSDDDETQVHCAGALAYALNHGTLPQVARIVERVRAFDGDAILRASGDLVWRSLREWLAGGTEAAPRPRRKAGKGGVR